MVVGLGCFVTIYTILGFPWISKFSECKMAKFVSNPKQKFIFLPPKNS